MGPPAAKAEGQGTDNQTVVGSPTPRVSQRNSGSIQNLYPSISGTYKQQYGAKPPVPPDVWSLFQDLQLLQHAKTQEDIDGVAWAFRAFAIAARNAEGRRSSEVAKALIRALPAKEHEAWFLLLEKDGRLCDILAGHPDAEAAIRDKVQAARSAVAIGVILEDMQRRWATLRHWQRDFLYREAPPALHVKASSGLGGGLLREAQRIVDVMDPDSFAFLFAEELIRAGSYELALKVLYECPVKQLAATISCGAPPKRHSYFELFRRFVVHGGAREANAFLGHLVRSGAYSEDSLSVFLRNEELRDALTFLLFFVSCARLRWQRRHPQVYSAGGEFTGFPSRRNFPCWPRCVFRRASEDEEQAFILLSISNLPHVLLSELLDRYEASAVSAREQLLHTRDFQHALEVVLLLSESTALARFVERLSDSRQGSLSKCLADWARLHLLRILEQNRPPLYSVEEAASKGFARRDVWVWSAAEGRGHYFKSDLRGSDEIALVLWAFFEMAMLLEPAIVCNLLKEGRSRCPAIDVLGYIKPPESALFAAISGDISKRLTKLSITEVRALMQCPGFYHPSVQALLGSGTVEDLRAVFHEDMAFARLMQVVARLVAFGQNGIEAKSLESSMRQLRDACDGHGPCLQLVMRVVDSALSKEDSDFLPADVEDPLNEPSLFTVSGLTCCARRLREACDTARNQTVQPTFDRVVGAFLETPPRSWVSLFNSLETVLFFLRFMEKEDLNLAYDKFAQENGDFSEDANMKNLLQQAKVYYKEPFVNILENADDLTNFNMREKLANRKLPIMPSSPKTAKRVKTFGNHDWNEIIEIAACTAESMKDKYNVPMLPHHTQMITLLIFAAQICQGPGNRQMPRTLLSRVGTGEGKSWIIGMLAAFVAKKGMKAHVVIDNDTLLERDFATMSSLFQKLRLSASKRELAKGRQITYCSCMDLEVFVLDRMKAGARESCFQDCVMIVDEVDSLIVDENVYNSYVSEYQEASDLAQWWWMNGKQADPYEPDSFRRTIISKLEAADLEMKRKQEGKHFAIDQYQGMVWALDERTAVLRRNAWFLWLELKRKQHLGNYQIRYMTKQNVICKKSCFSSYPFIFGLTGSLGTEAEKSYTKAHFNASHFLVPSFLDTCKGQARPRPKCIQTRLERNGEGQLDWTVKTAREHCVSVPVLIVARNLERVRSVASNLLYMLPSHRQGDHLGPGVIELLDAPGKEAEFQQLVELATQPLEADPKKDRAARCWRVTVTTAVGARGQDYHISDDLVDEKGGFLLILEYVPDSEREWIQFLGRTARHDHPGQYAVVLNMEEYNHIQDLGDGTRDGAVVRRILDHANSVNERRLAKTEDDIQRGVLMHSYTGHWLAWAKENSNNIQKRQENFSKWVELCESFEEKSVEDIKQAFSDMRLISEGFSEIKSPDGSTYHGDSIVLEGKRLRHGTGRCVFADGKVYSGQWEYGKMCGEGRMVWPDKREYAGQYQDNKMNGSGKFTWPDGSYYEGEWYKSKQHGKGAYVDARGARWVGEWAAGRKVGGSASYSGALHPGAHGSGLPSPAATPLQMSPLATGSRETNFFGEPQMQALSSDEWKGGSDTDRWEDHSDGQRETFVTNQRPTRRQRLHTKPP